MPAPEEIARAHQQRQKSIILSLIAAILGLWRRLDRDRLTESWQAGIGPSMVETMAQAQLQAAALAPAYLRDLAAAQGVTRGPLEVVPGALSGVASDGRPLESLLYQPIIQFKRLLSDGVTPEEAMRRATAHLAMIAATQAADAGRGAVEAGMAATREWVQYVRVVNLPACSRCIILAGRVYSHSTGFQRHPSCDCGMMPVTGDDVAVPSPRDLFDQMSQEEQDRRFGKAGAEAIRLGGDMGQIVNARRGMQQASVFGRDALITTEGTTRRGVAGRRLIEQGAATERVAEEFATRITRQGREQRQIRRERVRTPRLMPESILEAAGGDRDEAIRLLERFGYLRDPRRNVPAQPPAAIPQPRQSPEQVPSSPFHRSLDGIEDIGRIVQSGEPVSTRRLGGSSAITELATFADGVTAIRKAARPGEGDLQDADAEQLAAMVGRALGLRTPAVYRSDGSSIWMEYIADGETAEEAGAWAGELPARFADVPDSDEGRLLGLLDVLTHNADRNDGNWLLTAGGDLVPIDHGMAYGEIITPDYEPSLEYVNSVFADHYKAGANPLTAEDVTEVRARLQTLRPDFDLLDRGHWLDYSLHTLDMLAADASGDRNLIAGVR